MAWLEDFDIVVNLRTWDVLRGDFFRKHFSCHPKVSEYVDGGRNRSFPGNIFQFYFLSRRDSTPVLWNPIDCGEEQDPFFARMPSSDEK